MHVITTPRDGVPRVLSSTPEISAATRTLASGHGPIAIDTERAPAHRYDDRAFLIQLRRHGAGTFLIDPTVEPDAVEDMADVIDELSWLLHAGHSDLPALYSLGWTAPEILDTQIAAQLLGQGQMGLDPMLRRYLNLSLIKDKGAEDWSIRPLPQEMLAYAALDVEFLHELIAQCHRDLAEVLSLIHI